MFFAVSMPPFFISHDRRDVCTSASKYSSWSPLGVGLGDRGDLVALEDHEDVVVVVAVDRRRLTGREVHLPHADVLVLEQHLGADTAELALGRLTGHGGPPGRLRAPSPAMVTGVVASNLRQPGRTHPKRPGEVGPQVLDVLTTDAHPHQRRRDRRRPRPTGPAAPSWSRCRRGSWRARSAASPSPPPRPRPPRRAPRTRPSIPGPSICARPPRPRPGRRRRPG